MYLIHNGRVVEIDEDMDEETNEFLPGTHFGQMQGLIRDTPFNYSYKTTSKAEVLTLSLDKWENLLGYFPNSRYSIFKSYPNHPYSRHPDDEPEHQKDQLTVEKKRQMMARRKTEHELKSMPGTLGKRDVSPSESGTYKPFYTPPATTSTTTTPKPDSSASKAFGAKPAADVVTSSEAPAATIPDAKISTTKPTMTKVRSATEPVTEIPATRLASTKEPADTEPTTKISTAKVSAAKGLDSKMVTTKIPAAALAAVAGGAVVTGAAAAGAVALAAPSVSKGVSSTSTKPTALSDSGVMSPAASKQALANEPNKVSELKLKQLKDNLNTTLEMPKSSVTKGDRTLPKPTATVKKLQAELPGEGEESTFASLPVTKEPKGTDYLLADDRHSLPSSLTTKIEPSLPKDEKEEFLPGRGKTRTEIFDNLEELPHPPHENKTPQDIFVQSNDKDTRKVTKVKDQTDGSMAHLSDQVSHNTYVTDLLSPSNISDSKSVAMPLLKEDEIEELENMDIPDIKEESVFSKVPETIVTTVESKVPADTSIWPSEQKASEEKSIQKVSPVVNEPSSPSKLSRSESTIRTEVSLPYFDNDSDDDNDKKEEKRESEEYEEAPKSFIRRVTQHAKKFIGRPSVSVLKEGGETNASALEEDIKATSALLQKYEERSKKSKIPGADDGEKSLLTQYIEKRNAELATSQKEESEEEFIRQAPRRSIVVFGDDEAPPVRTIPIEKPDDDDEAAQISRAPRRSVVVFDSQGKSPLGVLSEETNYDSDEPNEQETLAVYGPNKNTPEDNATTVNLDSESRSPSDNPIDRSFEENYQSDDATELANVADDTESVLVNPKSTDGASELPIKADDDDIVTETISASQLLSAIPSLSSIKKPSLLQTLFRKKKPEEKSQTSLAMTNVSDIDEEDDDYERKLAEEDVLLAEKRISRVGYVDDKDENFDLSLLDDDDDGFKEGPSKPLPPQRKLKDDEQIKDIVEDEKKLDSDKDKQVKKTD